MAITISGDTPNFSAATITTGTVTTLTAPTSTITTLNAPSGVLATQNGMTGIAKAWVQYNGSTQTVIGSFNVLTVTYVSTGTYTVNFTTAFSNTTYSAIVGSSNNGFTRMIGSGTQTTTSCPVYSEYPSSIAGSTVRIDGTISAVFLGS